jgi:pyruvate/2-oxoglutarate dehydrogenase complex dihydrolipoamide acyltransferase (E2) component
MDLPAGRREMPKLLDLYWKKHAIYGLLDVDVTLIRQFIAAYKANTGEALSFTGYLVYCLARAVDEDKSVQAYLKGRKQLMVFDDVDVSMPVERQMGTTRAPMVHIVRGANRKTFLEIHQEIRSVQAQPVPLSKGFAPWILFFMRLPWPLPDLFGAMLRAVSRRDPAGTTVPIAGTVGVTAVGMFGQKGGWGLVPMVQSLGLVVGGIAMKPVVIEDRIEPREMLNLTVAFDHDVVDGAPAARFVRRLVELIESGYGLDEIELAHYRYPYAEKPVSVIEQ